MVGEEAGPDGFGWAIQWLAAFFYVDDGLLALTNPSRLQAVLDVLTLLSNSFVLHTNVEKMFGILCHP